MGLYEFNPDDAYRFAKQAGAETWKKGDELNFKFCPYCHGGSNHDKGTFKFNCTYKTYIFFLYIDYSVQKNCKLLLSFPFHS